MRLLKDDEEDLEALGKALAEGEQSGIVWDFDSEVFSEEIREKHAAKGWDLACRPLIADNDFVDAYWQFSIFFSAAEMPCSENT